MKGWSHFRDIWLSNRRDPRFFIQLNPILKIIDEDFESKTFVHYISNLWLTFTFVDLSAFNGKKNTFCKIITWFKDNVTTRNHWASWLPNDADLNWVNNKGVNLSWSAAAMQIKLSRSGYRLVMGNLGFEKRTDFLLQFPLPIDSLWPSSLAGSSSHRTNKRVFGDSH